MHCLLGENGAGKSTLIGILSGLHRPDAGTIRIEGVETSISSPRTALDLGIGTVHQHSALIPALTVLENLMLGDNRRLRLDEAGARKRLAELADLLGVDVDPDARAVDLALGHQQQVEIIKALWRGSRVLILDEPTSMLTPQGVAELTKVLARLKEQGQAVIFITHKLHEALSLGDFISILRQGRLAGTIDHQTLGRQARRRAARGDRADHVRRGGARRSPTSPSCARTSRRWRRRRRSTSGARPCSSSRASARRAREPELGVDEVSLELKQGEILGVAGVDGNGQRALAEVIAGQRGVSHGEVLLFGGPDHAACPSPRARSSDFATSPTTGSARGSSARCPVGLNLFLKRVGERPFWKHGRIQRGAVEERATRARPRVRRADDRASRPGRERSPAATSRRSCWRAS